MELIDSNILEEAVYSLCVKANTEYNFDLYNIILNKFNSSATKDDKIKYANILNNIKLAFDTKRPLCQDTGQVLVFVKIGKDVFVQGGTIASAVNNAVEKAYTDNYYRKSVVINSLFNRENTKNNCPAIVYTDIVDGSKIEIDLMIKGAGSENCSAVHMFKPSAKKEDIFKFIKDTIIKAGEKSCPPIVLGIGAGGTIDYAALLSKKAFFHQETQEESEFLAELKEYLGDISILDMHLMSAPTHIASLPVALTINCHSTRHSSCIISGAGITYEDNNCCYERIEVCSSDYKTVKTDDEKSLRALKAGDNILLTGKIYTARDAAHKRLKEYFDVHKALPFDLNNKIIFYAGPCPAAPGEVTGPVGPTTSARMDEFCEFMHSNGLLASIGKGERSPEAEAVIKKYKARYFTAQGGIACLLARCVKSVEPVAFEELGTEAVRKLYVENLPLKVMY